MTSLASLYQARLDDGNLRPDPAQAAVLPVLQAFVSQLAHATPKGFWAWGRPKKQPPRGLYLYGEVGRGKSMLMDMLFAAAPPLPKRRVHFHAFMLEIHERLHLLHQAETPDPLSRVAQEVAKGAHLLCFDEFHVSNIADAMILGRLFDALFAAGVAVVATSNWAPDRLYENGLQRDRFLPFISLIKAQMDVCSLNGQVDHRFDQIRDLDSYLTPLGAASTLELQRIFYHLTQNEDPQPLILPVQGRRLRLSHVARGVGFFNFSELCSAALGAADYLALAETLHTVLIDEVPRLSAEKRNETTRFMTLIDALYEAKTQLYLAAETPLADLGPKGDLALPFQRTLSRLMEMQGEGYKYQRP